MQKIELLFSKFDSYEKKIIDMDERLQTIQRCFENLLKVCGGERFQKLLGVAMDPPSFTHPPLNLQFDNPGVVENQPLFGNSQFVWASSSVGPHEGPISSTNVQNPPLLQSSTNLPLRGSVMVAIRSLLCCM